MKQLSHLLRLLVGLALVGGLLWALDSSWAKLRDVVELRPVYLPVVFLGTLLAALATAARWKWITEQLRGTHLPFATYFHALVLTRVVGLFTSTLAVDLVGRGIALRHAGSERPVSHATTVVVVERLHDLLLPAVMLPWALWARDSTPALGGSVLAFLSLAVLGHRPVVQLAGRAYTWLAARRAGRESEAPDEDIVAPELLTKRAAGIIVVASLGRYLGMWLYVVGVARSIGMSTSELDMLAATPLAQLSALLGFTPGGLGIQEIGWAGGLQLVGTGAAATAAFILAQRLAFLATFSLLSALSFPWRGRPDDQSAA